MAQTTGEDVHEAGPARPRRGHRKRRCLASSWPEDPRSDVPRHPACGEIARRGVLETEPLLPIGIGRQACVGIVETGLARLLQPAIHPGQRVVLRHGRPHPSAHRPEAASGHREVAGKVGIFGHSKCVLPRRVNWKTGSPASTQPRKPPLCASGSGGSVWAHRRCPTRWSAPWPARAAPRPAWIRRPHSARAGCPGRR